MNNYSKLENNLEKLYLNKINDNIDEYIDLINKNKKNFIDALYEYPEGQVSFKDENAKLSLIRTAGFPYNKTFEDFDLPYQAFQRDF